MTDAEGAAAAGLVMSLAAGACESGGDSSPLFSTTDSAGVLSRPIAVIGSRAYPAIGARFCLLAQDRFSG